MRHVQRGGQRGAVRAFLDVAAEVRDLAERLDHERADKLGRILRAAHRCGLPPEVAAFAGERRW